MNIKQKPAIYVYSYPSVLNTKGTVKIGKTDRNTKLRIKEQNAGQAEKPVVVLEWALDNLQKQYIKDIKNLLSLELEQAIHHELKKQGLKDYESPGVEWYRCAPPGLYEKDPEQCCKLVREKIFETIKQVTNETLFSKQSTVTSTTPSLLDYYTNIKSLIESDQFIIKAQPTFKNKTGLTSQDKKDAFREQCRANSHLESVHYLMYEFWVDRNDPRTVDVFNYVCIPHGVNNPNNKDNDGNVMDIDFRKWEPEYFIKEIMKIKVK